jgi:hypothetical protein
MIYKFLVNLFGSKAEKASLICEYGHTAIIDKIVDDYHVFRCNDCEAEAAFEVRSWDFRQDLRMDPWSKGFDLASRRARKIAEKAALDKAFRPDPEQIAQQALVEWREKHVQ